MGYWKCCFLFKLEDLSVLSLWGKDPKESHSNRHNIIPANQTPTSAQESGPFPGSFHLIVCSSPAGILHWVFIKGVSWQGKATKLQENTSSTRDLQQRCVNILQAKSCAALPVPGKPTGWHFPYHDEQSTILFHFSCFHQQLYGFPLPNYFHYSSN